MLWIGVYPTPFLERMEPTVQSVLERVRGGELPPGTAELGERADAAPGTGLRDLPPPPDTLVLDATPAGYVVRVVPAARGDR
jgi:hypothetical protein